LQAEVIVADNGSTDGSQAIAKTFGVHLISVPMRGYGAALLGGIMAARGRFVIIGDSDGSYDFSNLMPFVETLRAGSDMAVGNRFAGGIAPGAMPQLHRLLGNPLLSLFGRLLFGAKVHDFHCGLRGFDRERILALGLQTTGMEFATELIARATMAGYLVTEVPTTLSKDGRSRPSHLRPWADGWRHLRFMLMFSPRWLFLYPGLALLLLGLIGAALILPGPFYIGTVGIDVHTFIVVCVGIVLGLQCISFSIVAGRCATRFGLMPASRYSSWFEIWSLERVLAFAATLLLAGLIALLWCAYTWAAAGFGPLEYASLLRVLMLALTAVIAAVQIGFTALLVGMLDLPTWKYPE
jgi:hypothetical protein